MILSALKSGIYNQPAPIYYYGKIVKGFHRIDVYVGNCSITIANQISYCFCLHYRLILLLCLNLGMPSSSLQIQTA